MPDHDRRSFVMGSETECLTVMAPGADRGDVYRQFFAAVASLCPSLPGQDGLFVPLGRIYVDGEHLELATCECDSPFALASVQQGLETLAAEAAQRVHPAGTLRLWSIGYSGSLSPAGVAWGHHSNHLVPCLPGRLAPLMTPFLATQIFAGSGGPRLDNRTWVATARSVFLEQESGGGTMSRRALASTARDEPLSPDPVRYGYRFHAIHGDAHVEPLSRVLAAGTLALALRAATWYPEQLPPLPRVKSAPGRAAFWMRVNRRANALGPWEGPLTVEPFVAAVQRRYLDLVDRMLSDWPAAPGWASHVAAAWDAVVSSLERGDGGGLLRQLDPWAKHQTIGSWLRDEGLDWPQSHDRRGIARLSLACQDYHQLRPKPSSSSPKVVPTFEACPFAAIPPVATRAADRAVAILSLAGRSEVRCDWQVITEGEQRIREFSDPRARQGPLR